MIGDDYMKQGQYIISTLEPEDKDNWLTDGNTFGKLVYLGENDSADNWREVTPEEKAEIEKQQQAEVR